MSAFSYAWPAARDAQRAAEMLPLHDEVLETELLDRLLACADLLRSELARRASEANIGRVEFLALRELALARRPISPSELASLLRCSKAQVTKVTHRLAAAEYITKKRVQWTAHAKTLELTASGRDVLMSALDAVDPVESLASLTKLQQRQLHSLLGRLERSFDAGARAEVVHE